MIRERLVARKNAADGTQHTVISQKTKEEMNYYHERIVGILPKKSLPLLKIYNICIVGLLSIYFSGLLIGKINPRELLEQKTSQLIQNVPTRAFEAWDRNNVQFPCVHPQKSSEAEGIFYIKIPKTGSTTLAHITERIAYRESKRQKLLGVDGFTSCKTYSPMVHQKALGLNVTNRDKLKSFTWSMVRNPANRLISHFTMNVLLGNWDTSERSFFNAIDDPSWNPRNFQLDYLALQPVRVDSTDEEYTAIIQNILLEYNFIGIFERFHESLVVLSIIADIPISDVLYYLAPSRCGVQERPSWVTQNIEDYLEDEFIEEEKGDVLLYTAVNRSLDLTIAKLGHQNVQDKVNILNRLIKIGSEHAASKFLSGCGIPGITPHRAKENPYVDIHELKWFKELKAHDRKFVYEISSGNGSV